jgi:hypothetical protein
MELNKILQASGLRSDFIARKLFPENKHPYNALNRLLAGGGELKASQLITLAELLNTSVDTLLGTSAAKGRLTKNSITFLVDGFDVVYDANAGGCVIEKDGADVSQLFIGDAVTVREFLAAVQKKIKSINFINS